jgi:hypothetical protein
MAALEPSRLGSTGSPARIRGRFSNGAEVDVHIDVIVSISRAANRERTTTPIESGQSLTTHRLRQAETVTWEIKVSDVAPFVGALLTGQWETDHSAKTLARLLDAQACDQELELWNGKTFERTPAGTKVWVLDSLDHTMNVAEGSRSLSATLTFGESPRFSTIFTPSTLDVSDDLQDVVADSDERGRQSTVDAGDGGAISEGAWP